MSPSPAPCKYCEKGALLVSLRPVAALPAADVYLFEDTRHLGRCVVASRWHVRELHHLSDAQRDAFMADVSRVASTVTAVLVPDKINLGVYGDLSDHLHAHVVPKHVSGPQWGDAFALQPAPGSGDAEHAVVFDELVIRLRASLAG